MSDFQPASAAASRNRGGSCSSVTSGNAFGVGADSEFELFKDSSLRLMNNKRHAGQPQVKVRRPAKTDATRFHQIQSRGIRKRQILIRELSDQFNGFILLLK